MQIILHTTIECTTLNYTTNQERETEAIIWCALQIEHTHNIHTFISIDDKIKKKTQTKKINL